MYLSSGEDGRFGLQQALIPILSAYATIALLSVQGTYLRELEGVQCICKVTVLVIKHLYKNLLLISNTFSCYNIKI